MSSVRSSSRLAKAKTAESQSVMNVMDNAHDSDFAYEPEDEVQRPIQKRHRTTVTQGKGPTRKRQIRGRLSGLINMPIDVFTEIASHLLPGDIISLARSSKFFRDLLMRRSSKHIWLGSMNNIRGLPPCPNNMSEPQYLALLFSEHCTICGRNAKYKMDEIALRVRLCASCRRIKVVSLYSLPVDVFCFVHHSADIAASERRSGADPHVLRDEADVIVARFEELKNSGNEPAFEAWKEDRHQMVLKWREHTKQLIYFLETVETDQDYQELKVKANFRKDVERRLVQLGWESADMKFTFSSSMRSQWFSLVEQRKTLTDRIWQGILPKLIPMLQANRDARLRNERRDSRRACLEKLFVMIKAKASPVVQFEVFPTLNQHLTTASTNPVRISHTGVFPDLVDALDWPIVKQLYESDTEADQMEIRFQEHQSEINQHLAAWKLGVETYLANLLCVGRTQRPIVVPTVIFDNGAGNPLASLPDHMKVLLRGDSFFHTTRSLNGLPLVYEVAVAAWYRRWSISPTPSIKSLDLTRFGRYDEAHDAACMLLEDMGKPDACYLELRSLGQQYICARCHEDFPKAWEEIVYHYMEQKRQWDKIQPHLPTLAQSGVAYNNVHRPATGKPLIKHLSFAKQELESPTASPFLSCRLCAQAPIEFDVRGPKEKILTHILEVHDIAEPRIQEHYEDVSTLTSGGQAVSVIQGLPYNSEDDDGPYGPFE